MNKVSLLGLLQRSLLLPMAWTVAGCATYSGKPGSAILVDATTGRPLAAPPQGLVDAVPRQSPERLLHEACSDAVRPLAAYLD